MKNVLRHLSIGLVAALAACGSSSSGGGSAPAPLVDIDYSGPLTSVAIDSAASVGSVATSANGSLGGFAGAGDTSTVTGAAQAGPKVDVGVLLAALRKVGGASAVGVSESDTQLCAVSGSVVVRATYSDPTGATLRQGDTFSITFNACDDGAGVTGGSMRLTITASPDGAMFFADPTTMTPGVLYEMTMVVTNFVTVDPYGYYSGMEGDMAVGMTWEPDLDGMGGWLTSSISGTSIVVESGLNGVASQSASLSGVGGGRYSMESGEHFAYGLTDYSPDFTSAAFSARVCSTELGGCLNVVNDPPFVLGAYALYPASGTLRVSDDSNRFVEVTATSAAGNVTVSFDIGAGVQGPFATTWTCLDAVDSSSCFVP
jgi:hypothetical protein